MCWSPGGSLVTYRKLACLAAAASVGAFALAIIGHGWAVTPDYLVLVTILGLSLALNFGLALLAFDRQQAFEKMRRAEQSFRDLYDNISEGVFRSTLDGRMISANPSLVRLNGFASEPEMLREVNDIAHEWYVDPHRRDELNATLLANGRATFVSEIYRYKTRERIWIEENTRLVRDPRTGEPLYYEGTIREVTETIRRLALQDHYNKIASIVSGCLYQFRLRPDGTACLPYASIGLVHIFGIRPEAVTTDASPLFALVHRDDLAKLQASIENSRVTLTDWQCEYRICLPNGRMKWVFGHSVPEREPNGGTLWHGYLTDISERKRTEAKIHELAYFDPLTKLPNRTMLRERLGAALASAARHRRYGALLFIDLDQFKTLNDTKGHHIGDLLLCDIAGRLRGSLREQDLVARLGGDEFVVLLEGLCASAEQAKIHVWEIAGKILSAIDQPFVTEGHVFQPTASIGAALFCCDEVDLDDLLKRADLAMYAAKASGRGHLRFFQPGMQAEVEDRLALTADLRKAQMEGNLHLVYQPQVDRSGAWFGAEALLRWDHPTRGPIPPSEFIPLAERGGLLNALETWVLNTACATLSSWRNDPLTRNLHLAVNVSAQQAGRTGFVAAVTEALHATGADPHRLTLELTEHVMLSDFGKVAQSMLDLKKLGVSFALDDFGTGYSSLSYLKRLPIDTLKIDRSFVRDIETDPSDREIVQTILNFARSLEVGTIAEGVKTELQAIVLRQLGCLAFQGYLFAKPMRLDEFIADLRSRALNAGARFDTPLVSLN